MKGGYVKKLVQVRLGWTALLKLGAFSLLHSCCLRASCSPQYGKAASAEDITK